MGKRVPYLMVEEAYNLLLEGKTRAEIVEIIKEKHGYSAVRTDQFIQEAKRDIKRFSELNKEKALQRQLQRYNSLYEETREKELYKESIQALQQIDKLENLVTQKVDVTSKGEKITGITVEIIYPDKNNETKH